MTFEKTSYIPSQISFFEISEDTISQARKEILLECFLEIGEILPGIDLAFALFGSLSKAKPLNLKRAEITDIDVKIYFNEMKLNKLLDLHPEMFEKIGLYKDRDTIGLWRNNNVRNWIENYIFKKMNSRPEAFISDLDFIHTGYCADGVEKLVEKVQKGEATREELTCVFAFDVGGGLRRYQVAILQDIAKITSEATQNAVWGHIVQECIKFLRGGNMGKYGELNLVVPWDFKRACQLYRVRI